eukprot:4728853-Pyramimonas_sp.AAC.1
MFPKWCSFVGLLARQTRQFQTSAVSRAGMGQPLPKMEPITTAVSELREETWKGIRSPLCSVAPSVMMYKCSWRNWQALGMWSAGLSVFGLVAYAAKVNDKASKVPHVPKEFPFGGLETELGGLPTRPNNY